MDPKDIFKFTLGLERLPEPRAAETKMSSGTVLIGLKTSDGAILLADQKASMGNWGSIRDMEKILLINDRFALSLTGSASEGILMGEYLHEFINQWEDQYQEPATMKDVIQLYRNISLRSGGMYLASLIVGTDVYGAHLVDIMGFDGFFKTHCFLAANGSGSVFAKPLLEANYNKDIPAIEYNVCQKIVQTAKQEKVQMVKTIEELVKAQRPAQEIYEATRNPQTHHTLPDDGLTRVLRAAIISSHEDNANDPAQFTRPPYNIVIARPGKGIEIVPRDEISLRYELLLPEHMRGRGETKVNAEKILEYQQTLLEAKQ
jgi:20S proteasome alpha/beta subunit